jgi:DNA-binding transcriptional MerR regulator
MAPKARIQKRLYYKIGEACKALGIQPYVLRYWETEFPALSPSKSRSGQRVYSEKELEIIRRIKQLLYDEGYTIAGAKKKLEGELAAGALGEGGGAPAIGAAAAPSPFAAPGAAISAGAAEPPPARAPAPVATIPLPLVPRMPGAPPPPAPAASPSAGGRTAGAAAGLSQPARPTLPLSPPAASRDEAVAGTSREARDARDDAPAPGEPAAGTAVPGEPVPGAPALGASAPAAPTDRAPRARVTATADPRPAGTAPALDTAAAKQIETLRKGIQKALQEAREILALLDRSPQ